MPPHGGLAIGEALRQQCEAHLARPRLRPLLTGPRAHALGPPLDRRSGCPERVKGQGWARHKAAGRSDKGRCILHGRDGASFSRTIAVHCVIDPSELLLVAPCLG